MENPIHTEQYKGATISIYPDIEYNETPNDWNDDIVLINYHRDFWQESKIITQDEARQYYEGEKIPQEKTHYLFPISMYSHSGVSLSVHDVLEERGGWDTSQVGLLLVKKTEAPTRAKAYAIAKGTIRTWNDILSGNVYGYQATDDHDGEHISSCCGFIGDDVQAQMIEEAKAEINHYMQNEGAQKRKEEAMGYNKTLREFIASENPAIVRLAKGIKKEFTK